MKPLKALCAFLMFALLIVTATFAGAAQWKTVEKLWYDWRGDGKFYEFVLRAPSDYDAGGDYTQLQIIRRGKQLFSLSDNDGLAKYADALIENKNLGEKNALKSTHLLMFPLIKGKSKYPLLFLLGWPYGSSPGSLHVIALGDDGVPKEILNLTNFDISSFADLDNDSVTEIIGKRCLSESYGPNDDLLTYAPFSVYIFGSSSTSPMALDLKLTETYNKQNYYGWAGPECLEDIAVVLHPPGGGIPVVMEAMKAKALYSK